MAAYLYNGPEYLETYVAAFKGGFAPVNTNYRYGPDEIVYLFDNADAEAVVFHATFADADRRHPRPLAARCGAGTCVADGTGARCPTWAVDYETVVQPRRRPRRGAVGPLAATTCCCSTPAAPPACPRA